MLDKSLIKNKEIVTKFIVLSLIGVFMFFVPINIDGSKNIPVQHTMNLLIDKFYSVLMIIATILIIIGAIKPIYNKSFNKDKTSLIFNIGKIIGAIFTILLVTGIAPEAIAREDTGPFLFNALVMRVTILLPLCAIFLTFLLDYGFVDFAGEFLKPIMRTVFRSPGETAIVLLGAFLGSPSVGIVMANDMYREGRFSLREASVAVTGFSISTISFISIIAETSGLMDYWGIYLFTAVFSTLLVSAILSRLYPLSRISDSYYTNAELKETVNNGNIFHRAINNALSRAKSSGEIWPRVSEKLKNSFRMLLEILPNFMSIGVIALMLVNYTPLFDFLGYIFYPITSLLRIPEPMLASKASLLGLAELFLPVLLTVNAPFKTKFIIAAVAVSQMLMFSDNIITILASDIEVSIKDIMLIWIQRTILSFIVVTLIASIFI